jgi:Flp pilus assembly protein TadD
MVRLLRGARPRGRIRGVKLPRALVAALLATVGCGDRAPSAGPPTWAADVAPIVHRHCAGCHRPGSAAPFALLSYDDARRRARLIAEATESGIMPPFPPVPGYRRFANERRLSPAEIRVLADWARAGAPPGELARAPAPPAFRDGFELGEPDVLAEMPQAFTLPASGTDVFRNFLVPLAVAPGTRVRAVEVDPGNRAVVHHAALFADTSGASRRFEGREEEPGFDDMAGGAAPGGHFVGWTPGRGATVLEESMPWVVEEGTDLVLQLHMMPSGRSETVRARVGLWLTEAPRTERPAMIHLLATRLDIPPGESGYQAADQLELPVDVVAHSVYPHAHHLGRRIEAWAEQPDGTVEPLLRIDDWRFAWQEEYRFAEPVRLAAGSRLHLRVVYDNSADNPENPTQPPRRVIWGPSSLDEMGDLWLKVVPARREELGALEEALRRHESERFREGYALRLAVDPGDVEAHARLGIGLVQEGRHAAALPHLEAAVAQRADAWDVNYNLGVALAVLGRLREAAERYRRALDADPGDARTHNALAGTLLAEGRLEPAVAHYRRAVELRPASPELWSNLGLALHRSGDPEEAAASYRRALDLDPGHVPARTNYGGLLSDLGRDDEAAVLYRSVLELEPHRFDARVNLARSLARTGRFEEAEGHLRQALATRSEDAEIHYLHGLVLSRMGRLAEAVAALETAVRLRPEHEAARQDLEAVRALARRPAGAGP